MIKKLFKENMYKSARLQVRKSDPDAMAVTEGRVFDDDTDIKCDAPMTADEATAKLGEIEDSLKTVQAYFANNEPFTTPIVVQRTIMGESFIRGTQSVFIHQSF